MHGAAGGAQADPADDALELLTVAAGGRRGGRGNRLPLALGEVGELLGDVLQAERALVPPLGGRRTGRARTGFRLGAGRFRGLRRR